MELGKLIICKDGKRFLVVQISAEEGALLDLDGYVVLSVSDATQYINKNHFGVSRIEDAIVLSK